jgi:hypothetical protein
LNHIERACSPDVDEHAAIRVGGPECAAEAADVGVLASVATDEPGGNAGGVTGALTDEQAASTPMHAETATQEASGRNI